MQNTKLDWTSQMQSPVPANPMIALKQKQQTLDNITYASIGITNYGQADLPMRGPHKVNHYMSGSKQAALAGNLATIRQSTGNEVTSTDQ